MLGFYFYEVLLIFFFYLEMLQVLMESYNRLLEFVKRSNAVSPLVALETATALQVNDAV